MKPDKQLVTLIKSIIRVIGFGMLLFNPTIGVAMLIASECFTLIKQLL